MSNTIITDKPGNWFSLLKRAIHGEEMDYTSGSIRVAVIMLAIPMMLEMIMESVFALVDLYFVGHLENSSQAIQVVGLTESVLTIIYSLAIGMSMAATAVVARRVGEKNPDGAAHAGVQAMIVPFVITVIAEHRGIYLCERYFVADGCGGRNRSSRNCICTHNDGWKHGDHVAVSDQWYFPWCGKCGNGHEEPVASQTFVNIIFCPIIINGWGPVPALGLTGAAIATTAGRSIGVLYQIVPSIKRKRLHLKSKPRTGRLISR